MRKCTVCKERLVGDWIVGTICSICALAGAVDPKPRAAVPDRDRPANRFGLDEDARDE